MGGEQPIAVDVRLVVATNRSPQRAVQEGVLREDLYYRINVFPIGLPPLRERGSDVDLLAEHFLEQLNLGQGATKSLGPKAAERLRLHTWPGNVRELKNAVQRAFILAEDVIDLADLGVGGDGTRPPVPTGPGLSDIRVGLPLGEVERRMIVATLKQCEGDKRRAAEMLGISLKTLYNRLNQYAGGPASAASTGD